MNNKRRLKAILLAALAAVGTLILSGCGKQTPNFTGRLKVFKAGTHAIAVPFDGNPDKDAVQIPLQPGYEVMGINVSDHSNIYVVLYKNTEDVECVETENGYTIFGEVINENKTLALTQEE